MNWPRDFVVFTAGEWKENFHRKSLLQMIAQRPEVKRLFVVQIPADFMVAPFKKPYRLLDAFRTFFKREKVAENIYLYRPFNALHQLIAFKYSLLNCINRWLMHFQLKRLFLIERIDSNALVWIYRPELVDWMLFSSRIRLVYDCYDEYRLNALDQPQFRAAEMEDKLLKNAHVIFVTSRKLLKKAKTMNENAFLVFNAANIIHFVRAFLEKPERPTDMSHIPGPIIGYVGMIRDWLDFTLLKHVAVQNPNYSFIFVGPHAVNVQKQVGELVQLPNVYFLGKKTLSEIYRYLHFFDVAIIPNKRTKFNESVVPYKLFEYLAAGRIVVATNTCEDFRIDFKDYLLLADSPESFSQQLKKALTLGEQNKKNNFEFGKDQSWENRVSQMMYILKKLKV